MYVYDVTGFNCILTRFIFNFFAGKTVTRPLRNPLRNNTEAPVPENERTPLLRAGSDSGSDIGCSRSDTPPVHVSQDEIVQSPDHLEHGRNRHDWRSEVGTGGNGAESSAAKRMDDGDPAVSITASMNNYACFSDSDDVSEVGKLVPEVPPDVHQSEFSRHCDNLPDSVDPDRLSPDVHITPAGVPTDNVIEEESEANRTSAQKSPFHDNENQNDL